MGGESGFLAATICNMSFDAESAEDDQQLSIPCRDRIEQVVATPAICANM